MWDFCGVEKIPDQCGLEKQFLISHMKFDFTTLQLALSTAAHSCSNLATLYLKQCSNMDGKSSSDEGVYSCNWVGKSQG